MFDLGNELRYYFGTKAVEEGQKRNAKGKYDLNPIGVYLGGLTQDDMARTGAEVAYNSKQGLELQQRAADVNKPLTQQDFLNPTSRVKAEARIKKAEAEKNKKIEEESLSGKLVTAQLANLTASAEQTKAASDLADRQQGFLERLETMKLTDREADRTQNLRILQMQQDAENDRYNQNLALYKEDQKQGQINNLVAGLVSLGAAFAL
tara:strand:+ start:1367 stop:1987 length:621 start_codon:yes stop_codon:yes gene_type:complete